MKNYRLRSRTLRFIAALSVLVLAVPLAQAEEVTVAYIDGAESSTKAQMLRHVLETKTDYQVNLTKTSVDDMWAGVAEDRYDVAVSVLLPQQASYQKRFGDQVEDLGPNWIGSDFSIHTIVRKGYEQDDVKIVRFLNNYCLCGARMQVAMALNVDGEITRQEALVWMSENEAWITNMMGFVRPFDDREQRGVTY